MRVGKRRRHQPPARLDHPARLGRNARRDLDDPPILYRDVDSCFPIGKTPRPDQQIQHVTPVGLPSGP
jgi:hypothetical protein